MLTKEQARSERDAQKREQVFFSFFFAFAGETTRHGGVIIPHVWLRRQEVSHREADTVTPDCWGGTGCYEAPLGRGIRPRSVVEAPGSAAATAVWCVWAHTPRLCACVRELEVRCRIGFLSAKCPN